MSISVPVFNLNVYAPYLIAEYVLYDDGIRVWRKMVRDDSLMFDYAITDLGFDGVEDTDWANAKEIAIPV
jgi:hypothetical protein